MCVCVGVVAFKQTSFTSERPEGNWRIEHGPGLDMAARGCEGGCRIWGKEVGLGLGLVRVGIQGGSTHSSGKSQKCNLKLQEN